MSSSEDSDSDSDSNLLGGFTFLFGLRAASAFIGPTLAFLTFVNSCFSHFACCWCFFSLAFTCLICLWSSFSSPSLHFVSLSSLIRFLEFFQ